MPIYVIHPGYVTLLNTSTPIYIDAGTLAANYGLSPGEYTVSTTSEQEISEDGQIIHVHLHPREDGKYRNIKVLYGDNGTDSHIDKMVGWRKRQQERRKYI
jgi:hypothetical protein